MKRKYNKTKLYKVSISMTKLLSIFFIISISCFAQSNLNSYSTSLEYAQVKKVIVSKKANGGYCFKVTIRHNDTGWDNYADAWKVSDMHGNTIATRVLGHPHVDEQPFTRSMCGIVIPSSTKRVIISAKSTKNGYKGKPYIYTIKK